MSQKPVFERLRIKENYKLLIINEPEGYREKLGDLPPKVIVTNSAYQTFNLVQFFVTSKRNGKTTPVDKDPPLKKWTTLGDISKRN